jgi:signal transduction histidine kinase
LEYVLLAYGAVFVSTGFALGLQARAASPFEPVPRDGLWALMAFALVHGAADWTQLGTYLEQQGYGTFSAGLALARLALLAASYAFMGAFGLLLALPRAGKGRARIAAGVPAAAFAAWAAAYGVAVARGGALDPEGVAGAEAATRYLLGIPACALGVLGLERVWRRVREEKWRTSRFVAIACVALALYGILTGLVVPASGVGLARTLNVTSFGAVVHVPVELFRAAAIAVTGLLVSEVFVRTTTEHLQREVEHLRDDFISLVAHDLRTPLGTVETGASLLDRLPPEEHGTEREAKIIRAIRASVRTMRKIVDDLLDVSRLESRRLSVSRERLDLGPLLLRLLEWAPAEAVRGHTLRLVPPDSLPPVLADPVRVEQVLSNLLSNAGKYSPPASEIVIAAWSGPREVTLSVTNQGPGIPPRDLSRVFSRHYRTARASTGRAPGLGLGLYIAKGLVEAQGGRIWAESEPGKVTTFSFTLPRASPGRAARAPKALSRDAASIPGPHAPDRHAP